MQIRIVTVGSPELKQGPKAKYSVFELEYSVDGTLKKRKIMSFSKEVYPTLKDASPGDFYDIVTKKNGEYWDWVGITKVEQTEGGTVASTKSGKQSADAMSKEEWAQKEVRSLRSYCVANACTLFAGKDGSLEDVLNAARVFEAYVFSTVELEDNEVE